MKYVLPALVLGLSASTYSANDSNLSAGLGPDHGGPGAKHSINRENNKYFASSGLLSYVERSGSAIGYGIGRERMVFSENQGLGLSLGSLDSKHLGEEATTYHGVSAFYNYYFSGFTKKSFVVGASVLSVFTSEYENYFEEKTNGANIQLAYQW